MNCNRNFHSYISPSNFLVNKWYLFENFRYQGPLSKGLPNGLGYVEYRNGTKISGRFVNGILNDNEAKYYIPLIGNIVGVVASGLLISGQITYHNGDVYTGKIQSYLPNGHGIFLKKNNDIFRGNFQMGRFLSGKLFESKTGSIFQGSFKNWKPDGEVVEIKPNGTVIAEIYKDGIIQTETLLKAKALNNVKNQNEHEIKKIDENITKLSKQKEEEIKKFPAEKARLEEELSRMCITCNCYLPKEDPTYYQCCRIYLSVIDKNEYSREIGDLIKYHKLENHPQVVKYSEKWDWLKNKTVVLPEGSSDIVEIQACLKQIELEVAINIECKKWAADRANYDRAGSDKITSLLNSHRRYLDNVETEIKEIKRKKELAYQRQLSEDKMRIEAERNKIEKEMNVRAQKALEAHREFCKLQPICCSPKMKVSCQ